MEQCGVPLSDDIKDEMYLDKSHEADITKFADIMHEKMKAAYPETNLYCAPVKFAVRPDCGPPAK